MVQKIWNSKILTNNGDFHQELEQTLCKYLGVEFISIFSNGTLALITALQSMRITGEVITTPYSFVATTHALHWNGIKPVFVDIDPDYLNLDPKKIEAAITPQTTAILPVHIYGNPCNIKRIQEIANAYGLKVIYDAAHAFGVKIKGESILNFGDLSILSFHATKVFNTFEGGAIVCHDKETKLRIDQLKNFGFVDETTVVAPGINAKMNEIQSAFGLLQLNYVDESIKKRKILAERYYKMLSDIRGINILNINSNINPNYGYFPIFIDDNIFPVNRDELYQLFKNIGIYTRRYFYPLISNFPTYKGLASSCVDNLPVATEASLQVLCLPIYPDLKIEEVEIICQYIKNIK